MVHKGVADVNYPRGAAQHEQAPNKSGPRQVAQPHRHPDDDQITARDSLFEPPERHVHVVAGKQLGPGKNHQRQGDSERRPHNQFSALGICVTAENENKNDPKAHIGACHHGSDEKAAGIALKRFHLAIGKVGEMVDRFVVHQPSFQAAPVHVRRGGSPPLRSGDLSHPSVCGQHRQASWKSSALDNCGRVRSSASQEAG